MRTMAAPRLDTSSRVSHPSVTPRRRRFASSRTHSTATSARGDPIHYPETYLEELSIDVKIGSDGPPPGSSSVARTTFSSRDIIKPLTGPGFVLVGGKGSYTTPVTRIPRLVGVRMVTVHKDDMIPVGTLQNPAE